MRDVAQALKELIRIDTSNPPGDEMRALVWIASRLKGTRAQVALQPLANGRRGNLVARIPGAEGTQSPLVFLSHVDVVPADASRWRFPPFEAAEDKGYLYGRGAVDTKQLTVMELSAFLSLCAAGPLNRDVYLVATGDEECGSELGLKSLLAGSVQLGGREITGQEIFRNAQVISEGGGFPVLAGGQTLYLLETGQKGCGQAEFTLREQGGVYLTGSGALRRAMGLVADVNATVPERRKTKTLLGFEAALCAALGCGAEALTGALSPLMANVLTAMRGNTLTPTLIQSPGLREVTVTCDARLLPGYGPEYLTRLAEPLAHRWGAELRVTFSEGYESDAGDTAGLLEACLRKELPPDMGRVTLVPFLSMGSSDGRFLRPLNAAVYGFSPVLPWDMTFDQAVRMVHGVDERIHRDSLQFGCRVLTRAAHRLTGTAEKEEA